MNRLTGALKVLKATMSSPVASRRSLVPMLISGISLIAQQNIWRRIILLMLKYHDFLDVHLYVLVAETYISTFLHGQEWELVTSHMLAEMPRVSLL
jgi:hypothetical protein